MTGDCRFKSELADDSPRVRRIPPLEQAAYGIRGEVAPFEEEQFYVGHTT